MGALENTRRWVPFFLRSPLHVRSLALSLGDLKWKRWGVTAEPEVKTKLIDGQRGYGSHVWELEFDLWPAGSQWAFMVLVSDGISSVVSDQEVVDLAGGARNPKHSAQRILSFAEEMGSSDNLTAMVLPFAGWGRISGPDQTKKLREYRSSQMSQSIPVFDDWSFLSSSPPAVGAERQKRM